MKQLLILTISLLLLGCNQKQRLLIEPYNFEIKGFEWEPNPYKFSKFIQDSIIHKNGNQYAAYEYSYIGDMQQTLAIWDKEFTPRDKLSQEEIAAFNQFERKNAKAVILEKAKDAEVTIINEAHHIPQHRVFTTELLKEMYNLGYRHLGMETFLSSTKSDSTLRANKYPVLTNGYYVKEPQFGNIIRQAVKIGYSIFGYESQGHNGSKEREINQAKNIKAYLEQHPNSKYLIHCGFAHGAEGIYGGSWEKTMASRLTEFTGINPLTINQTSFSEKSKREYENPYYQLVDVEQPSVYVYQDSIFGKYREGSWFDISIFHPRTKNFDRPNWLLTGNRKIVPFHFEELEESGPFLVFAYLQGEEIGKAIPYDLKETNNKKVNLVLEEGNYNIIILSKNGKGYKHLLEN